MAKALYTVEVEEEEEEDPEEKRLQAGGLPFCKEMKECGHECGGV